MQECVTTGLSRTKVYQKVLHILKMPLNYSNIIGLPCKISKKLEDFEKIAFLRFAMGLFSPTHAFSGGFLADISETVRLR